MAKTQESLATKQGSYTLDGTLLEACSCGILCPCWVGEDPDEGSCYAFNAYHFDSGQINGIDVSGLNVVKIVQIPGNVLTPGSWKLVYFVDDRATPEQKDALVDMFDGKFGGPLADLAGLVDEVLGVESAPIVHTVEEGKGTIRIGDVLSSEMEPYRGPDDTVTTLRDSLFSTVPGSPAWVGKASTHTVNLPKYGMVWDFEGRNAIQAEYKIHHAG